MNLHPVHPLAGAVAATALLAAGLLAPAGQAAADDAPRAVPQCTSGDLSVRYRATDAAMSHRFGEIVATNVSGHVCRTGGYGGLSYVGHGDGTQIGAAADRDATGAGPHPITLKPGQHAVSRVSETVAQVYPKHRCRPTHVDGFRVYVPDETHSLYVRHPTTGCANPKVHLLSHQAFS